MNIPTKITISRIVLVVGMLISLLVLEYIPNFSAPTVGNPAYGVNVVSLVTACVFIVAACTDFIDGHLARKWNQVTDLGKFLDPVADKLLVDSLLIYLIVPHCYNSCPNLGVGHAYLTIPTWCVIIMILRDLVVDSLRFIAAGKGQVLAANKFGKIKTVCQMVAIPVVLLNGWPFSYFDNAWPAEFRIGTILIYIATAASFLSGVIYIWQNKSVFKEGNNNGQKN